MGKIADLSYHQGNIDWAKASKELDLVILRVQDASFADPKLASYAASCKKYGIPFGVYAYFRAGTKAKAEAEMSSFYARAASLDPLFWVIDAEDSGNTHAAISAAASYLRKKGCKKLGLYVAHNLYNQLKPKKGEFDFIWIPRYGKNTGTLAGSTKPAYPCDMWQYTSAGSLAGVSGKVDLNTLQGSKKLSWYTEGAKAPTSAPSKTVAQLADEVLAGKYGNGEARKKALGAKYAAVQAEVNKRVSSKAAYYPKATDATSIVDALKSIKVNSSLANRAKIARANGIGLYVGASSQNTKLLNLLRSGKLKKP